MIILLLILCAVIGYLLGSINSAVIVGKVFYKKDVREYGSKNAGLTNTLRVFDKKAAVMVLVGDILKGVMACVIGSLISPQYGLIIGGLMAVIGHNWPLYFKFKGGKGVLTSATVILMFDWKIGLIVLGIFIIIVAITKYVSLGSILASTSLVIFAIIMGKDIVFIAVSIILASLIIYRHKQNVKRLLKGEENKLQFNKGKKSDS